MGGASRTHGRNGKRIKYIYW